MSHDEIIEQATKVMHAEVCCPCDPQGCDWTHTREVRYAHALADARTRLPQALAALQAVLDLHKPEEYDGYPHSPDGVMCAVCLTEYDTYEEWPCPTVRAIQDALGENNE